ncbi:MAG: histidine phosphatase family protein [Acidimicrobiia bacterium]|nr:histidine phosphatase family protein [Acidimicrobiia bacterium]
MIYLVRHGETAANRARLALGRADPELTERGRLQADGLAVALGSVEVARVISSPLRRAVETATVIASAVGAEVEVEARLVEMDYGDWDERSFSELPADALARWRKDARFAPPNGESLDAVGVRVAEWCEPLIEGPPIVAVSHVSPIKAAAIWAMGADPLMAWRMHLDVASISRIGAPNRLPCLLGFNDTAHLGDQRTR